MRVEKRINEIVNRLTKTKVIKEIDFRQEREDRDRKERDGKKELLKELKEKEKEEMKRKAEQAELKNYSSLMKETNMKSNQVRYSFILYYLQENIAIF